MIGDPSSQGYIKYRYPRAVAHIFVWAVVACVGFLPLSSLSAYGQTRADATQIAPEGKFIEDLASKGKSIEVDTSLTPEKLRAQYRDMLNNSFDIQAINEYVIGRTWQQVTLQQKEDYLALFKDFVLTTYGAPLHLKSDDDIHVKTVGLRNIEDSMVSTEITHGNGIAPTPVDWIVRRGNGGKLIITDVIIDGVNLNQKERDDFADTLSSNGNSFDTLLQALRQKVNQDPATKDQAFR